MYFVKYDLQSSIPFSALSSLIALLHSRYISSSNSLDILELKFNSSSIDIPKNLAKTGSNSISG